MSYTWKTFKPKADANLVQKEIESIGSDITPKQIVDFARNKNTELHKCFEWNDSIAAEKYREQQARVIVCNIVYVKDEETKEPTNIRAISYSTITNSYKPTRLILHKQEEYQALLEKAFSELRAFKEKYHSLSELEEIFALID